ncbi:hypothetical protein OA92_17835 [Marinomonas sp. SBI22]|uniref:outer membrane beta-barrel protein n=1 Tax=unclassified Marinomonas TaxID=196814 RepID=UPI0007AF7DEA|nr:MULTISPECIES: outer membrane beta-barrel protein [unclassified Marinomonas]KZM39936.1 hypothetical protein OA92_17835 [Marinomonas sp. SBI22]KZM41230.1 hypothetical protein OA91_17070 [Marinomonas sp. SBI8L]
MKKKLVSVILLANAYVFPTYASENFSIEALLGRANQAINVVGEDTKEGDSTSKGIRFSYFMNDNFSLDVSYVNYGSASYKTSSVSVRTKSSVKSIGIQGLLPINEKLKLSARGGISFWEFDTVEAFTSSTNIWTFDDDGMDPYYGLGLEYILDDKVSLGLDLSYIKMGIEPSNLTADHEVINTSLSLGYRF